MAEAASVMGKSERLAAIEAERRAIEAARAEVRLAALDAEAASILDAEAAAAEAKREAVHAAALARHAAAESKVADEVVRVLVPLMDEVSAAEAEVLASGKPGRYDGVRSVRVPFFLRESVRRTLVWWRNWWPEALGEPARVERGVDALGDARERVQVCEAMVRQLGQNSSGHEQWRDALEQARRRVAELGGEPYRAPVRQAVTQWLSGLAGGD